MKKLIMAVCVMAAAVCFGREAAFAKSFHDRSVKANVKIADEHMKRLFGSKDVYDLCLAAEWDADKIVDGLEGKEFSGVFVAGLKGFVSKKKFGDFVRVVAKRDRTMAISFLNDTPAGGVSEDDEKAVFASDASGIEPFIVTEKTPPESSLRTYAVVRASEVGKPVRTRHPQEAAFYVDWLLLGGPRKAVKDVKDAKEMLKDAAEKAVKAALRKQGKTFVVKNGVNPIEAAMAPVVNALNAPKLDGLEAALRGVGIDCRDRGDLTAVWSAIEAEKDDVFYGRKAAHQQADGGIILLLGPDGYNAWVDLYNGGK